MKKLWASLLLLALMLQLTACGGFFSEEAALPEPTAEVPTENTEPQPLTITFTPKDHSIYGASADTKIELIYDLATLSGGDPQVTEPINRYLLEQYDAYQRELADLDLQQTAASMASGTYFFNEKGIVSYNDGKILSLFYYTDWMMGGIHNLIPYGYTFDLTTGLRPSLDALFSQEPEYLLDLIQTKIRLHLINNGLSGDAYDMQTQQQTIDAYTLDSFAYYLSDSGELIVCIPVGELASEAAGSLTVPCDIYLNAQNAATQPELPTEIPQVEFLGQPVAKLSQHYGMPYVSDFYAGGRYLRFGESPYYFLQCGPETPISQELLVNQIMVTDRRLMVDNIYSGVTFPELYTAVADTMSLPEPEYTYDEVDDIYMYYLRFEYGGYIFSVQWFDDPATTCAGLMFMLPIQ